MIGKTFATSLNITNPNTYVKFFFLRTSPLTVEDPDEHQDNRETLETRNNYAKDLTPSVTQLINASLTSSELPTPLKLATVSPIFKNGDPSLATQYRPISLLPLVSKLLEKVVARQLRSYLEEFSIISKEQFAYR